MAQVTTNETDTNPQRIMEAATAEFAEKGYEATKMAEIAKRAGLSLRTLYNYARRKEMLYLHVQGMTFFQQILEAAQRAPATTTIAKAVGDHLATSDDRPVFDKVELQAFDLLLFEQLEIELANIALERLGPGSNGLAARTEAALAVVAVKSLQWPEYTVEAEKGAQVRKKWTQVMAVLCDSAVKTLKR